jgi:choline kinase
MVVTGHPGMLGDEGPYVRGIILAAGDGGRLYPLTAEIPKPLLPVAGRPLVSYTIEALVAAEVDDLVIVVGHRGDDIRAALGDGSGFAASIRYVENPRYRGGNGHSLWCAREYLAHGAIVVMADHLVTRELVERMLSGPGDQPRIAADFGIEQPWIARDSTKIAFDRAGRIAAIGKMLTDYEAVDAGIFYLTPDVHEYLIEDPNLEVVDVLRAFSTRPGGLIATDVTGSFWRDIDTPAELAAAGAVIPGRRALPTSLDP